MGVVWNSQKFSNYNRTGRMVTGDNGWNVVTIRTYMRTNKKRKMFMF